MFCESGTDVLGVLGGMGPLASAEFVRTIYEYSGGRLCREQDAPRVILYSDPTFPDRTEAILNRTDEELLDKLTESLRWLYRMGATKMVVCCVTIHYLLPKLPDELRSRVLSLVDVIVDGVRARRESCLLITSTGTRRMALFENHPQWSLVKDQIVLLNESDQQKVHALIYQIKGNRSLERTRAFLLSLLSIYKVDSFIAGCTEIHLIAKLLRGSDHGQKAYSCIDPLQVIAHRIVESVTSKAEMMQESKTDQ
jgi:aspartate racemase